MWRWSCLCILVQCASVVATHSSIFFTEDEPDNELHGIPDDSLRHALLDVRTAAYAHVQVVNMWVSANEWAGGYVRVCQDIAEAEFKRAMRYFWKWANNFRLIGTNEDITRNAQALTIYLRTEARLRAEECLRRALIDATENNAVSDAVMLEAPPRRMTTANSPAPATRATWLARSWKWLRSRFEVGNRRQERRG